MIECQICKQLFNTIHSRHLSHHNLTKQQYIETYPDAPLQSEESKVKRKLAAANRQASMTEEARAIASEKIRQSRLGKSSWNKGKGGYKLEWSEEAKQRVKENGPWNKGIPITEEQRRKQSITVKQQYASGEKVSPTLGQSRPEHVRKAVSEANMKRVWTEEQLQKMSERMQARIASPDYINFMKGKTHTEETKLKMSKANIINAPKVREAMEKAGHWIPLSQTPELLKYRRQVWKHTNKNVHLIPDYDASKRGICKLDSDHYQVDHIISIVEGWAEGITPEQLSHPSNLRFIPWKQNLDKWKKSEMTKEDLLKLI